MLMCTYAQKVINSHMCIRFGGLVRLVQTAIYLSKIIGVAILNAVSNGIHNTGVYKHNNIS